MGEIFLKAFEALWQVLVAGIILGAGLPAVFALGSRRSARAARSPPTGPRTPPRPPGRVGRARRCSSPSASRRILFGIFLVVATGFGLKIFGS